MVFILSICAATSSSVGSVRVPRLASAWLILQDANVVNGVILNSVSAGKVGKVNCQLSLLSKVDGLTGGLVSNDGLG